MANTIALPTGRSMESQTLALLEQAGVNVKKAHPRSIFGTVEGIPNLERAVFCRPSEITRLVRFAKDVNFGITGRDLLFNSKQQYHVGISGAEIEFGRSGVSGAKCVLFTRNDDSVEAVSELKDIEGASIATEYPDETKEFFKRCFGADRAFEFQTWSGSAEVAVMTGLARFGVSLVETGSTFAVNGLRPLIDGVLYNSNPVLIGNKSWLKCPVKDETHEAYSTLAMLLSGVTLARKSVMLAMNLPKEKLTELTNVIPAMQSPTVQPLADQVFVSVTSVVPKDQAISVMRTARLLGAKDIVQMQVPLIVK